jgi:hypothetical protein
MAFESVIASVTGPSHIAEGRGGEDAGIAATSPDGRWHCVVLCDGCGTASAAAEGARYTASAIRDTLLGLSTKLDKQAPGDWVIDEVVVALAAIRSRMRALLGPDLAPYAATVVAALLSESGGFVLHIGDGIATALKRDKPAGDGTLRFVCHSPPENGEYSNETFYLVESNWIHHVRLTPVTAADLVVLATDGAQALLYENNAIHPPALTSVMAMAFDGEEDSSSGIARYLSSNHAESLSRDDKTLAIILRQTAKRHLAEGKITAIVGMPQSSPPPPPPLSPAIYYSGIATPGSVHSPLSAITPPVKCSQRLKLKPILRRSIVIVILVVAVLVGATVDEIKFNDFGAIANRIKSLIESIRPTTDQVPNDPKLDDRGDKDTAPAPKGDEPNPPPRGSPQDRPSDGSEQPSRSQRTPIPIRD